MLYYHVDDKLDLPSFVTNSSFHKNHQAALYQKEIERKEKRWYRNIFPNAEKFTKYIWPSDEWQL